MEEKKESKVQHFIGIDIGSTSAKVVVLGTDGQIEQTFLQPTGWSSVDTAEDLKRQMEETGVDFTSCKSVATGYGRAAVPYVDKTVTEITCHAQGATRLYEKDTLMIIDIGGQDTKIIKIKDGMVDDFMMNDKCSAGTGRFLEVMANVLGMKPGTMIEMAREGAASGTTISSMCTVFAESEVISLIGKGESKENIAFGIIDSIVSKVASQAKRMLSSGAGSGTYAGQVCLTGGLCDAPYIIELLGEKLGTPVVTNPLGRFAGALGAAVQAERLAKREEA